MNSRTIFFCDRSRGQVVSWDPAENHSRVIVGSTGDPWTVSDPYGLAWLPDRGLVIADKNHHRLLIWNEGQFEVFATRDPDGHRHGAPQSRVDAPANPTGLWAMSDGSLLVTYDCDHTIYKVAPDGSLHLQIGTPAHERILMGYQAASPPGVCFVPNMPVAIASLADGTMFFIERGFNTVREFHPQRGVRDVFGGDLRERNYSGAALPDVIPCSGFRPDWPTGLAVDAQGGVYIADAHHRRVWKLDRDRDALRTAVVLPPAPTGGPAGITCDEDGWLWVVDPGEGIVSGYRCLVDGRFERISGTCPLGLCTRRDSIFGSPGAGIISINMKRGSLT